MSVLATSAVNSNVMTSLLTETKEAEFVLPKQGEFVEGEVVSIKKKRIIVTTGPAAVGLIAGREALDGLNTAKNLTVGDKVRAFVLEEENEDGYFVLSLRRAGQERAWKKLKQSQKSKEIMEVMVREANRGGLIAEYSGIQAFIPVSQLAPEHYPRVSGSNPNEILSRLKKLIGKKLQVQAILVNEADDKLIFSERAAVSSARRKALNKLKVGQKIRGKVSGITNFGIFILFNNCLEGLVHLSELAWSHISDPAHVTRLGEEKEAIVLAFDQKKIALSVRQLTPDPWLNLIEGLKVNEVVEGKIEKITTYGALVELKKNLTGLLHFSEVEEDRPEFKVGQKIQMKIIEIKPKEHRVGLSVKALKDIKIEEPKEQAKETAEKTPEKEAKTGKKIKQEVKDPKEKKSEKKQTKKRKTEDKTEKAEAKEKAKKA